MSVAEAEEKIMRSLLAAAALMTACASQSPVDRIETFRAARERGDVATAQKYVAPDARIWFEEKKGEGDPFGVDSGGRWDHWDRYFHSKTTLSDWKVDDRTATAVANETNDFMQALDWKPKPYTVTYWLDSQGRIEGVLIKSMPGKAVNRLDEFKAWARQHHPDELAYLMPNDKLDPTGDRPERWHAILDEWRGVKGTSKNVE